MSIYYNPLDVRCKSTIGGIKQDEKIKFAVFCQEKDISSDKLLFVLNMDGHEAEYLPMKRTDFGYSLVLKIHEPGLYFYHFMANGVKIGKGKLSEAIFGEHSDSYQITVYDKNFSTPDWFKGGIMYQIFPDRFNKVGEYPVGENKILRTDWGATPYYKPNEEGKVLNNDFFGGNLNGIKEKLPYLKSLNVNVIYLNPIFESASNHRYDTGDYMNIDSLLGTVEDFDSLVEEAEKVGIKIILDGVFNHTGDNSRYFNKYGQYDSSGAYQSKESPYSDWYSFTRFPDSYESWWGIDTLPAINEKSESYRDFIFGESGVLKNWLRHGIGGYRLDVADELPDFFLKELRKSVKSENNEAIIIGEVWEDASNKIAYSQRRKYLQGNELDSVMNYPLKDAIIDYVLSRNNYLLRNTLCNLIDHYPKCVLDSLMNILGTHDTNRILTVLGEKFCFTKDEMSVTFMNSNERQKALKRLKTAVFLQYTLPGIPCVYYGDEEGMEGYCDPFCRRCFDWDNINKDLNDYYVMLGRLRKNELKDILKDGVYADLSPDCNLFVFRRGDNDNCAYFFINNSDCLYHFKLNGNYKELLNNNIYENSCDVLPGEYGILMKIK